MTTPRFLSLALLLACAGAADAAVSMPVTVGAHGSAPLLAAAPDGTLYLSAQQFLYRSRDDGATWAPLPAPSALSPMLPADSAIAVDPAGTLYLAFDNLGAGSTALCTSADRGDSWRCNPSIVPGGVPRLWIDAPSASTAYAVTNMALSQAAFLASANAGAAWLPTNFLLGEIAPVTGPLMTSAVTGHVLQAAKIHDPGDDVDHVWVYVYQPGAGALGTAALAPPRVSPLLQPNGVPSGAIDAAGTLYLLSEATNAASGQRLAIARSADEGRTWAALPALPGSAAGTATLGWLTAGAGGHVGVLYYYSPSSGIAATLPGGAAWSVMWAESWDADGANPAWTVTKVEDIGHSGAICGNCTGDAHFAGAFLNARFDDLERAHLAWVTEDAMLATAVRYAGASLPSAPETPAASAADGGGGGALNLALLAPLALVAMARRRVRRRQ